MECQSVQDVIDSLRCEILDPDGDIWSDKLLIDYIQQAYTHIASLRPDIFSESKEVTLEGGTCLQQVCDCDELTKVLSIDGNECDPPEEESPDNNLLFLNTLFPGVEECKDGDEPYNPNWYPVDCGGCTAFRLTEPVPTDREVKAIICCVFSIDFCKEDASDIILPSVLFTKFYEGFKHLVLSKIYATDRKAEDLIELSQLHFKYWQDFRDWLFRTDFARRQSDWDLYRQQTNTDYSR